ncbi:MAG TPA: aspartate 1-decarboxylase [candidate division Zixibacteria bacterium]|nr:aspartate 1-decarboxylase [candidate division Zixibacteria bacterium]
MFRIWCRSKISKARLTGVELDYEGSIEIPSDLLEAADILPGERVQVVNMNNGDRLETYVIEGKAGSGHVMLNGPAARRGMVGDVVMILAYAIGSDDEIAPPRLVLLDEKNRIVEIK